MSTFKRIPEFIDNGCPFCDAPPDEFCLTASGLVRRDHDARVKARTIPSEGEPTPADRSIGTEVPA